MNVAKVEALIAAERMTPKGLAVHAARDAARTGIYSFERAAAKFAPSHLMRFRATKAAWAWFQSQSPGYRRLTTFWVMNAKSEATRLRRLEKLIAASTKQLRL